MSGHPEERPDVVPISTPYDLSLKQVHEALAMSEIKFEDLPHLTAYPSADRLLGPFVPGDLWTVGARTGNGKTSWLLTLLDGLADAMYRVLFITTEIKAAQMRRQWAAMRLGFDQSAVLENNWGALPDLARRQIDEDVVYQVREMAEAALFVDLPRLDRQSVGRVLQDYAIGEGYKIVILDHINRWRPRDDSQKTAEMTKAVQGFKEVSLKHDLCVLLAAQISRGQDRSPLADLGPPPMSALQQTSALEQESSLVLMLHRQRRSDCTAEMVREVVQGTREGKELIEPGVMAMTVAKHRRRGHVLGSMVKFRLGKGGRVLDQEQPPLPLEPPPREPGEEEIPF